VKSEGAAFEGTWRDDKDLKTVEELKESVQGGFSRFICQM